MEETTAERGACLTPGEREELLRIARNAAIACVSEGKMPKAHPPPSPAHPKLAAPGAAFVTLRSGGYLRGCIGYTEAHAPLYRVVQECAVAAATEDPRFPRVTKEEVADLRIEISVLTPLSPIRPEDVTVGVHGLQIRKGANRGLLLPQVAVEHGWDRQMFLSQVCRKAGLPPDAWKEDAELYSFTAEVFGE
ncbi:MAG: AmmeMemoRadiSam system protein A [Candidatus Deferrimicrobiaceae bacterium]